MIKKSLLLLTLITLLTGCSVVKSNEHVEAGRENANFQNASNVTIITDTNTGCEYIVLNKVSNNAVMSPYYNEDGQVNGCKNLVIPNQ